MNAAALEPVSTGETQYTTFFVGDLLLGLSISRVREINRHLDVTVVPHAPDFVLGVINLRGDVVTVLDLASIIGLPRREVTRNSRNVVIHWEDQLVGLAVDRIADIVAISPEEITPPPANIGAADGRFFRGVHTTDDEIIVLLALDEFLNNPEL